MVSRARSKNIKESSFEVFCVSHIFSPVAEFDTVCSFAFQLNGFVDKYGASVTMDFGTSAEEAKASSQFMFVEAFINCLTNCNTDGRVLLTRSGMLMPRYQNYF